MSLLLGKMELLQWASQAAHVPTMQKYDDLKDGFVFLALAEKLFPIADPTLVRKQRSGPRNAAMNWQALQGCLEAAGIPLDFVDRKGIAAGHQKPCYNLLVMFYFLSKLKSNSDFSVDFAHPIDDALAAFLQSPKSVECLQRSPVNQPQPQATIASNESTRLVTNNAHNSLSTANVNGTGAGGGISTSFQAHPRSASPAHPAQLSPRKDTHSSSGILGQGHTPAPKGPARWNNEEIQQVGEVRIAQLQSEVQSLKHRLALADTELNHVKLISQHALDQQKILIENEIMKASQQFHAQLTSSQLEAEHRVTRASLECKHLLDSVLHTIEVEKASTMVEGSPTQSEVLALRETKVALEKKLKAQEMAVESLEESKKLLQGQVQANAASLERLSRAVRGASRVIDRLGPQAGVDELPDAAQRLIALRLAELQEEVNKYRVVASRAQEDLRATENQLQSAAGSVELAQAKTRIKSLEGMLGYLRRQLSQEKEKDSVIRKDDLFAEKEGDLGLSIPSICIESSTMDEIAADVLTSLESMQPNLQAEQYSNLYDGFWRLSSAGIVMRKRVEAARTSLRQLASLHRESARSAAMERRKLEVELDRMRSEHNSMQSHPSSLSDVTVEYKTEIALLRRELETTRHDAAEASQKMRAHLQAALQGVDQQQLSLRSQNSKYIKQLSLLTQREKSWKQLVTLLDVKGPRREDQIGALKNILDQSELASGANHLDRDDDGSQALATLKAQLLNSLQEVDHLRNDTVSLRDQVRNLTTKSESLEAALAKLRAEEDQLRTDAVKLRQRNLDLEQRVSGMEMDRKTERDSWRLAKTELEQFALQAAAGQSNARPPISATSMFAGFSSDFESRQAQGGNGFQSNSWQVRDSMYSESNNTSRTGWERDGDLERPLGQPSAARMNPVPRPTSGSDTGASALESLMRSSDPQRQRKEERGQERDSGLGGSGTGYNQHPTTSTGAAPASQPSQGAPAKSETTTSGASSSVLSPTQLEKRKLEILSKYGVPGFN